MSLKTKTRFLKVHYFFIFPLLCKKPIDFKKIYAENKWLDYKIVESLFKVLDSLWPEIFPQKTSKKI